jgi:predicted metalloprotease
MHRKRLDSTTSKFARPAMRWEGERESENVEDVRGASGGGFGSGMLGGMSGRQVAFHGGWGSLLLILLISVIFHVNPLQLLQGPQGPAGNQPGFNPGVAPQGAIDPAHDKLAHFVKVVLADTEDVWDAQFRRMGKEYRKPRLVLFSQNYPSACGFADAATGPFYCPEDEKVYIDLGFYDELSRRFHAPGDFAQAYVIAHEVGHHVQKLLGTEQRISALRQRASKRDANELSVRLELQADFLAGVWAHDAQQMKQILDPGDLEEAINAATAIGDDRLQKQAQGFVVPDSFTHGTSAQRVKWFRKGFETGDINQGDTFSTKDL